MLKEQRRCAGFVVGDPILAAQADSPRILAECGRSWTPGLTVSETRILLGVHIHWQVVATVGQGLLKQNLYRLCFRRNFSTLLSFVSNKSSAAVWPD
jgi:hypothetical protein